MKLLNLGCGAKFHPDWTNVDFSSTGNGVIAHDLRNKLPFPDSSFDAVYSSHVLEHFEKQKAIIFLNECRRVLKQNGILRVVVPDLEQIVRQYLLQLENALADNESSNNKYEWITVELLDQMVRTRSGGEMAEFWKKDPLPEENYIFSRVGSEARQYLIDRRSNPPTHPQSTIGIRAAFYRLRKALQSPNKIREFIVKALLRDDYHAYSLGKFRLSGEVHQWMYDRYSIKQLLISAGFNDILVCSANQSEIVDFNSYYLDIDQDGHTRKPDSLFVEAIRS